LLSDGHQRLIATLRRSATIRAIYTLDTADAPQPGHAMPHACYALRFDALPPAASPDHFGLRKKELEIRYCDTLILKEVLSLI